MGDEDFYQTALQEFDSGNADEGLLAKAWVNANGEESRKKIEYIKLRVSQLKSARVKRTAVAAGAAAKIAVPGILGLLFFLAKVIALLVIAVTGVVGLLQITSKPNPENTIGSVLAGVLVIYIISKLAEWAFLKRVVKSHPVMVGLSTVVSFLVIFALWHSGKDKPYAVHPSLLLDFLLASVLLIVGRTSHGCLRTHLLRGST